MFTQKDWDDILTHHTTNVEILPSFAHNAYIGSFTPDLTTLLTTSTHPDPFILESVREQSSGMLLRHKEVLKSDIEHVDKSVQSFVARAPAPASAGAKGSAMGQSFWPGGFSSDEEDEKEEEVGGLTDVKQL